MDGETPIRTGAACLLSGLRWLLVGGALAPFGAVPAEAAIGAGGALAGVAWLLVGAGVYLLAGTLLPAVVGAVSLICGASVFAYYDPDEPVVDDWERDRPEQ